MTSFSAPFRTLAHCQPPLSVLQRMLLPLMQLMLPRGGAEGVDVGPEGGYETMWGCFCVVPSVGFYSQPKPVYCYSKQYKTRERETWGQGLKNTQFLTTTAVAHSLIVAWLFLHIIHIIARPRHCTAR